MSVPSDTMHASDLEPPGLMVPRSIFPRLRRTLQREVGSDTSARILHHLGLDAGTEFEAHLRDRLGDPPEEFPPDDYFRELSAVFATMGWGTLTFTRVHPGLSFIETSEWAEADTDSPAGDPSCHFSGGVFASLLARAADAPIAVLEVICRTRGDDACGFLFGSEEAIQGLHTLLLEGATLEEALERL